MTFALATQFHRLHRLHSSSLDPALCCTHGNTAGAGAAEQIIHNRDKDENLVMNDDLSSLPALCPVCACACISALNQIELDIGDGGGEAGGQRCPHTMSGAGSLAPLLEPGPGSRLLLVTQLVSIGIGIRANNEPSRSFHMLALEKVLLWPSPC